MRGILRALILGAAGVCAAMSAIAATPASGDVSASQPKGTVCFARDLREGQVPIACKGVGKFASIAELYERGYRVVSVVTETPGTVYIFIEKRD